MSIPVEQTIIEVAGVMRCCLATVALEYEGQLVSEGDESACRHCGMRFRLVPEGERPSWHPPKPEGQLIWKPLWQIEASEEAS